MKKLILCSILLSSFVASNAHAIVSLKPPQDPVVVILDVVDLQDGTTVITARIKGVLVRIIRLNSGEMTDLTPIKEEILDDWIRNGF